MWFDGLPRHIFVNDMSDGFCPDVDAWGWLLPHLDAMEKSPHIWLLLTKWPDRMREFFASLGGTPDNFRLGVSCENQAAADERIPLLLQTPAAVHFVSAEPLLGAIDFSPWIGNTWIDHLDRAREKRHPHNLDQIIVGGESGPGARPMHPNWVRGIRDQCQAAGVPFFFKQHGAWVAHDVWHQADKPRYTRWGCMNVEGRYFDQTTTWNGIQYRPEDGREVSMYRVGKKAAGRQLDGRTWEEMPND